MKKLREHQFWDKLLETNAHAKGNNALNMEQLYCEKNENKFIPMKSMETINLCVQSSKHV